MASKVENSASDTGLHLLSQRQVLLKGGDHFTCYVKGNGALFLRENDVIGRSIHESRAFDS